MERGIIQVDPRHTVRSIRKAMQGNVIRALVELITNTDDSYIRLEETCAPENRTIEVLYAKDGYCGVFAVRDYAEGMSLRDIQQGFKKYGGATSGMKAGQRVRGYFGQGAKDALASMEDGRICTFKNDIFIECKLFIKRDQPMYEISEPAQATEKLRTEHKIKGNGTTAYFKSDPRKNCRVPKLNSVQELLANNYQLRKIMINPRRKVMLIDKTTGKMRRLRYILPTGKEILSESFSIPFKEYGDFPVYMSICRAEQDLTQMGDDRTGGLLIIDDQGVVLGVSLFKYNNEPLAARFFGEIRIGNFRKLLGKEEAVLREERDGLEERHPFCEILIPEIERRLEDKVNEEKLRRQKEDSSKIDREEANRYKKAFSILNEIAEREAQAVINLGQMDTDAIEDPPNGFCIYPSSAQITVGKRYNFELRINTNIIAQGTNIRISSNNSKIRVFTSEIQVLPEDGTRVLRKYISVEAKESNIEGIIQAELDNKLSKAKVFVVPEKDLLFSEGMVFQPETLTLRPNQPRKVNLLVYIKMIEGGSKININSDSDTEAIKISKNEVIVTEANAIRHVSKYEFEIWGEGEGQEAIITASFENYIALLEVKVRSKEEEEKKNKKGMFNDPEFNYDLEPLQRTSYSAETGRVIIYVNFPSVKYYLGDYCIYRATLPAQVMIADLVAERCFLEIAKKKVDSSAALIRAEARSDKVQSEAYMLSRKYGKKIHKALVDTELIDEVKKVIGGEKKASCVL